MARGIFSEHDVDPEDLEDLTVIEPEDDVEPVYTQAGPVKITKADGSVEIRPAYSPDEFAKVVQ